MSRSFVTLRSLEGFKFYGRKTIVHNLDPRAKALFITTVFVVSLLFTNLYVLLGLLTVHVPFLLAAGVLRRWVYSIRAGALLAGIIFFANLLTGSGVLPALALTVRFLVLLTTFSLFFMTTSPDDLGLALEARGFPGREDRTSLYELRFKASDYLLVLGSSTVLAVSMWIFVIHPVLRLPF